jgi:hypothetical protein
MVKAASAVFFLGAAWLVLHLSGMGILIGERTEYVVTPYKVCTYLHSTGVYDEIISFSEDLKPKDLQVLKRPCHKTTKF